MSKKGLRRKIKNLQVKVGEIIKIKSLLGMPPSGTYRVDAIMGELLMLSAGEIHAGFTEIVSSFKDAIYQSRNRGIVVKLKFLALLLAIAPSA